MKLSDYLDQHNLTRTGFAAMIGVSPETVRLWLSSTPTPVPQDRFLRRIVEATEGKVTVVDFLSSEVMPVQEAAQ